jgi:hypothetical protein
MIRRSLFRGVTIPWLLVVRSPSSSVASGKFFGVIFSTGRSFVKTSAQKLIRIASQGTKLNRTAAVARGRGPNDGTGLDLPPRKI